MSSTIATLAKVGLSVVAIVLTVVIAYRLGAAQWLLEIVDWLESLGAWGPVLFILLEIAVVVLVLPSVLFTLSAGFLFGVVQGSLYVVIGTSIGAAFAFLAARHLLGPRASAYLLSHRKLKLIDEELVREGWKVILLTRLIPFFPFKLSNYFFGATRFRFRDFLLGTVLGIVPITLINVYIGSLAASVSALGAENSLANRGVVIYVGGLVVAIGAVLYVTRLARRALARYSVSDVGAQ